jgi:hypothetical protein
MLLTGECCCDGTDRVVLVGWYLQVSVGWMVLTGVCCFDGIDRGELVGWY